MLIGLECLDPSGNADNANQDGLTPYTTYKMKKTSAVPTDSIFMLHNLGNKSNLLRANIHPVFEQFSLFTCAAQDLLNSEMLFN